MPEQVIKNNGQNHIHQEYIWKKNPPQTTSTQAYFTTFFIRKGKKGKRG